MHYRLIKISRRRRRHDGPDRRRRMSRAEKDEEGGRDGRELGPEDFETPVHLLATKQKTCGAGRLVKPRRDSLFYYHRRCHKYSTSQPAKCAYCTLLSAWATYPAMILGCLSDFHSEPYFYPTQD